MMSEKTEIRLSRFHVPTKPFDASDAINRIAVATGNFGAAMSSVCSDFNGHHITVSWNSYRGYYVTEFFWGGRVVLARGSASECVRAALYEWKSQGKGAAVTLSIKVEDAEDAKAAAALISGVSFVEGKEAQPYSWWTWKHTEAASAVNFERQLGCPYTTFLLQAETKEQYDELVAKHLADRRAA